ncbi:indolepyruvate ferredoxin oxidoreductase [Rhodoligotrophos appendicifer]|uniref:indolepyruvate ferredoxin oxidoreductase family protein n=1 Tax=Rhodoligotrophos appendicifer TaxID=987056 RepID=UPI0011849B36|nr:indolepyruvate ferredoxin oxidoreductase family protein [Rhodoligotrophos appendicifer]
MALRQVSLSDRYELREGQIFLSGVQALVRLPMMQIDADRAQGRNTAGYVTGYPGSPLASLDVQLRQAKDVLASRGVTFQPGLNEDLALTAIWGSQQGEARGDSRYDGVCSYWYGKGAGLDRSGDALRHGNLAGSSPKGGVLLLVGDDHRAESSSVAHYSEYTMLDFMIPLLNPADVAELIEYGLYGIALSRFSGSWAALKCTHDVVESAASISVDDRLRSYVTPLDFELPPGGLNLRYPDTPLGQEARLHNHKIPAMLAFQRANPLDRIVWGKGERRLGIVTTGKTTLDVVEALEEIGIGAEEAATFGIHLYKVAMTWPLEPWGVKAFCRDMERIFVVEEKRSLIESQLKELLVNDRSGIVVGKRDEMGMSLLPSTGTLSSRVIALAIGKELAKLGQTGPFVAKLQEMEARENAKVIPLSPMDRKPSFCSGCPHNRSTVVPEGSRGGAGTGCNYMAMWMDRGSVGYTQMGADGVNWIGEAPFSHRTHVFQNMGDGTYTHSGLLAIRAAVAAGVNITFKILFNGVVAMTGGQPHDFALTVPVILKQVLAEGVQRAIVVADDPDRHADEELPEGVRVHHRNDLDHVQRELRGVPGVTVLVYDQMCATEKRRRRKRGLMEDPTKRVFINHAVCEGCGDCGAKSSCVSILPRETALGRKREIDQFSCNKDYSCIEGFCPSFVTIHGGTLRKPETKTLAGSASLPDPILPSLAEPFNIVMAGVGGTGVITLAAILGMAAHLEGKGCATLDMMGLAQKGGAVTSHVRISASPETSPAARIGVEQADILLGFDLLAAIGEEAISTIRFGKTQIIANTAEVMPGDFARQPDLAFPTRSVRQRLEAAAGTSQVSYLDATTLATEAAGDALAANAWLVGFAFQKGLIPLSMTALERAFELNGAAVEMNKAALQAGRGAALGEANPKVASRSAPTEDLSSLDALIAHRSRLLKAYQNRRYARRFETFVEQVRAADTQAFGEAGAFTRAVVQSLSKLMAYKDEYEVGRLFSDGSFEEDLRQRFTGDFTLHYHLAPPLFAKRDPVTGHLKKKEYGPWVARAFGVLASFRFVRGSVLDPFGHSEERRMERRMIEDYRTEIEQLVPKLTADTYETAVAIASLPMDIRGFGHVKEANQARVEQRRQALHAALDAPQCLIAAE